ncbi:PREDICTED: antigen KI-67 isoform X3 [Lepidothrix coronata]|uniref:Antigen KI-67 isoform X3 n=1 Tax=Lepidothrix coronata TaxID=321398 RepID=A0A6J0GRU9_9PASS|nr:PREDICTED: antigen KI-67 isoform X3 [Lepidothrix coronata]
MPRYGKIIVIKRNGTDGIVFPLTSTSCLFGRKTECDIRMRLPWVSNEHCKIEINENKEAVLTNLSAVNPTQLNGVCFEQPVPLKHGDVLTIIDRSFRFEYPLQSTPKKRRSRSPKDETLQVAEVELLHKQTSGSKSLGASDNAECEEKIANENKPITEENVSKALPVKPKTPKRSHRIHQVIKKQNEMSPFTNLYEKLKREMQTKKSLQKGNDSQQAAREGGESVVPEPSAQISSPGCDLGSLNKGKERGRSGNMEECVIVRSEVNHSGFQQLAAGGSAPRRSFPRSLQNSLSQEVSRDTSQSHLQNPEELSTPVTSKGAKVTPSKESGENSLFSLQQCSIERLDSSVREKIHISTTHTPKVSEADKHVLSTPRPRRKSPRSPFVSPSKEITGMNPVNANTPTTRWRVSLKPKCLSEIPAETPREGSGITQLPFPENKSMKQRRNSKGRPSGTPAQEVLKEISDQANFNSEVGLSESPSSFSNSKSPRRNSRQSKEFLDKSVHTETLASEELMASPAGQTPGSGRKRGRPRSSERKRGRPRSSERKRGRPRSSERKRGRPRSSGMLTETALETNTVQEHPGKTRDRKESGTPAELAMEGHHQKQDLEDAGDIRPRGLSAKRGSGSAPMLEDNKAVPETNTSGLLGGEDSGKTKRLSQKRKSDDLLLQTSGKRKRVSFGGHLSPELFDKSLPPNSPLKRGALPARLSLPYGTSPRAVLKKAQGLKLFTDQEEQMSQRSLPAQKSPAASSPSSGKAAPQVPSGSPAPYRKGRFSISQLPVPLPIPEEKDSGAQDLNAREKSGVRVKTPQSSPINQDDKTFASATPAKLTRSAQVGLKGTSTKRRSGAVGVLHAKRSGASSANLLVAKSWAEVVKLGVARPQTKTSKKSVRRGRPPKRINQPPKTPERKIKGHFSTGHAESPATIVVGRAYSTTLRSAGRVPKVVKNPVLKLNMNMDESFTGVPEMFQTPENKSEKTLPLAAAQSADFTPTCAAGDISDLHTPEESGEMMVSPLNNSDASEQKQESPGICHLLREKSSLSSVFDEISTKTPEKRKSVQEDNINVDSLSIIPERQASLVKSGRKRSTPKQKLEPVEVMSDIKQLLRTPEKGSEAVEFFSGIKQLLKTPKQNTEPAEALSGIRQLMRTPKEKLEPAEALSGIRRLMRTPKQELEPAEALSGIRQLMRTPKEKLEPAEALSGIKQLMKTPKQKLEPAEALSGIKRLMRTPKQKLEPAEALSGIKRLMRTPKQNTEPAEALSGIRQLMRTPKEKLEPAEALSGIRRLMRTPKQELEPAEALSGIRQLMRTPKEKLEPAEALSGIKELLRTPRRKPEPVEDLSGIRQLMRTPQQEPEPVTDEIALKRLLKTPVQKRGAVKGRAGVTSVQKTPKQKYPAVEDMIGISRIFKTPKEKVQPIENMFGISRLVKSPRQKNQPVEDFVGLQRLMAEPRQKPSDGEVDYAGMTEMFDTPEEMEVRSVMDSQQDSAPPCCNSSQKCENKGNTSQGEDSPQKESNSAGQSPQRRRRGRPRKTVHPAAAKQSEKDVNLKELQSLDTSSTQEEMGAITPENKGRGRRTKRCLQEVVSKHPDQEPHGATQRPGRGKRRELKELKHPSETLESCVEGSSVLPEEPANMKQPLQECGVDDMLESGDDPAKKTGSGSIQKENCQLQTDVNKSDSKSNDSGIEDSEEVLLSPRKRTRGVENTEPPIPPKRGRRARNDQVKQDPSAELHGTTRRLRKDPPAKVLQRDEQTFDKDPEAVTAEEPEKGTELEVQVTEKRVRSLRSTRNRKHSAEGKADTCGVTQNIQKTEETSNQTEAQPHIKNEMEVSQGYETENAQEITTEASQRLKAESPCGETNKLPVTAVNLEANRRAAQETNGTRSRRGKKDSWEQKTEEFTEDGSNLKLIPSKFRSDTEADESLKDSLGSVCVKNTSQVTKDQNSPAAMSVPAANSDSLAPGHQKQARNQQGILKAKQTEILQENPAQRNRAVFRRGKKVNFELGEGSSKEVEIKSSLPGDAEGMTDNSQHENLENPSRVRRGRRKQVYSIPQTASPTFMEKQTLTADHSEDEAFVKEQDAALEGAPCSVEANPPRRGRRQEVGAASQTSRSPSVRTRRGLLEGGDKKMTVREDENPALGNKTSQVKANASARDRRKKIDLAAEAKSSAPLQRKCGLSETDAKDGGANEEQSVSLETVSCAEEKPLGRGRRKETALASHTTNPIPLRGKRGLPADNGREDTPKIEQNIPLKTDDSSVKENQLRKSRRKEIALKEATSPNQGEQVPSKLSGRKNNYREAKKVSLENSSQENRDLSKENSRQTSASVAGSSTSLQGLPEDSKDGAPEEQESKLLEGASPAKENLSRVSRKKTTSSTSEETTSTSLREKPSLPKGRGQKRILKEAEATPPENNSCQGRTRQVRNNRRAVQFTSEAATSTSLHENSESPENGNALETENLCVTSTGCEGRNQSGKGKEGNPVPQVMSTSRRRKCQLPADDSAPKKLKSGNAENGSLGKGKRNKTKEELGKENVRAAQTSGVMDRKTRSSTRTRK